MCMTKYDKIQQYNVDTPENNRCELNRVSGVWLCRTEGDRYCTCLRQSISSSSSSTSCASWSAKKSFHRKHQQYDQFIHSCNIHIYNDPTKGLVRLEYRSNAGCFVYYSLVPRVVPLWFLDTVFLAQGRVFHLMQLTLGNVFASNGSLLRICFVVKSSQSYHTTVVQQQTKHIHIIYEEWSVIYMKIYWMSIILALKQTCTRFISIQLNWPHEWCISSLQMTASLKNSIGCKVLASPYYFGPHWQNRLLLN